MPDLIRFSPFSETAQVFHEGVTYSVDRNYHVTARLWRDGAEIAFPVIADTEIWQKIIAKVDFSRASVLRHAYPFRVEKLWRSKSNNHPWMETFDFASEDEAKQRCLKGAEGHTLDFACVIDSRRDAVVFNLERHVAPRRTVALSRSP